VAVTTIVGVQVGADQVTFATSADPSAPCEAVSRWTVPRAHPDATVVVSEDGLRLEERDPATGDVLGVLATWDEAAGQPTGTGVTAQPDAPSDCAPEDPTTDTPSSTVAG
jgi:hypothetical protein